MLVNLAEMLKRWSDHPENQKKMAEAASSSGKQSRPESIERRVETKTRLLLQEPKILAGAEKSDSLNPNPPSQKGKVAWHHD